MALVMMRAVLLGASALSWQLFTPLVRAQYLARLEIETWESLPETALAFHDFETGSEGINLRLLQGPFNDTQVEAGARLAVVDGENCVEITAKNVNASASSTMDGGYLEILGDGGAGYSLAPTVISWKARVETLTANVGAVRIGGGMTPAAPALCTVYFGSDGLIHIDDGSGTYDLVTSAAYAAGVWHLFELIVDWIAEPSRFTLLVDGAHVGTQTSSSPTISSISRIVLYNEDRFAASWFDNFSIEKAHSFGVKVTAIPPATAVAMEIVPNGVTGAPSLTNCIPSGSVVTIDLTGRVVAAGCNGNTPEADASFYDASIEFLCTVAAPSVVLDGFQNSMNSEGLAEDEARVLLGPSSDFSLFDSILYFQQDIMTASQSSTDLLDLLLDCSNPGPGVLMKYPGDSPSYYIEQNSVIWARACRSGRQSSKIIRSSDIMVAVRPPHITSVLASTGLNIDIATVEIRSSSMLLNTTIYYSLGDGGQSPPWCDMIYGPQAFPPSGKLSDEGGLVTIEGKVTNVKAVACRSGNEASTITIESASITSSWFFAGLAATTLCVILGTLFMLGMCLKSTIFPRNRAFIIRRVWLALTGGNKVPLKDHAVPSLASEKKKNRLQGGKDYSISEVAPLRKIPFPPSADGVVQSDAANDDGNIESDEESIFGDDQDATQSRAPEPVTYVHK